MNKNNTAFSIDGKFQEGKLYCVCYACRVSVAACNVCVACGYKCKCAHSCGCVADGGDAMAAFYYFPYCIHLPLAGE